MPASSANDDDSRAELTVQRTALEGILARYGLRLEPSFGEAPAEARDSSPYGASLLRAKLLASEGSRTVEVRPQHPNPMSPKPTWLGLGLGLGLAEGSRAVEVRPARTLAPSSPSPPRSPSPPPSNPNPSPNPKPDPHPHPNPHPNPNPSADVSREQPGPPPRFMRAQPFRLELGTRRGARSRTLP